ncbi:arylsulfatase [Roseimaritima ulvae]|nr:arylsulfatase [Roseimaritima ulvae]
MSSPIRIAVAVLTYVVLFPTAQAQTAERPNVLLILADDLGYSDLGCYGSEIETPNLDRLAEGGLRFTQFYNTARCWPTRAALLTGYYAQTVRRDIVPGVRSGGRGVRQDWATLLPVHLKPLGYRSYHSGKWHIDGMPIENGFDRSYLLKDQGRFFNPQVHWQDDERLPPVEKDSGYYATEAIGQHAIECLEEHHRQHADKPFFHYLAFTAPHFPLHALPQDIEKYKSIYRQGWEKVRQQRWAKIKQMGLLEGELSAVERDLGPPYAFPDHLEILGSGEVNRPVPWDALTAEQQKFQADKMAIHAAMIDRMDQVIGKVLRQLEAMGQSDNTLVMFLSDNGSSAEIMVRADGHDPQAPPGSAASYLCLGPGWSTTGNTPFRRHKTWTHEGGISTPLIASWPRGIQHSGAIRRQVGHVIDVLPTIVELAGGTLDVPEAESVRPALPGKSLVAVLQKDAPLQRDWLWWFHDGHKAIRVGKWKAVAAKDGPWELYDLAADRAESNDLAESNPDRLRRLVQLWDEQLAAHAAAAQEQ